MRKLSLCMTSLCLLTSCHSISVVSDSNFEKNAVLDVYLKNAHYAEELQLVWRSLYPQQENGLNFVNDEEVADVVFGSDMDAMKHSTEALQVSVHEEYVVKESLVYDALADVFVPVAGNGWVFLWNTAIAKERGIPDNINKTFEQLSEYPLEYYHNRTIPYIYPFLFSSNTKDSEVTGLDIMNKDMNETLVMYKELTKEINMNDNMYSQDNFYVQMLCGLISTQSDVRESTLYQEGKLHFTSMPTYKGEMFHPLVRTYGFWIKENTDVPNMATAFLQLVRSQQGIQAMIDADVTVPLIQKEDVDNFYIYDHGLKEMIIAMNDNQLYDLRTIRESPDENVMDRYENGDMTSIIKNYIMGAEDVASIVKKLTKDVQRESMFQFTKK